MPNNELLGASDYLTRSYPAITYTALPHTDPVTWQHLLSRCTHAQVDKSKMTQMFSQQQEMVPFEKPVEVKGMSL